MTNNNNININNFLLIMKKNLVYAMMSAIALTSAVSFTGCASDDGASVDTNPTYDGTSVRTDFAFNITKASQGTRMTATNVQESGNFRGMTNMYLLPFTGEPGTVTTSNAASFALGSLANNAISASQSSKVYSITIPIGTDNFLFYGKATNEGALTPAEVGAVTSTLAPSTSAVSLDNISFSLTNIAELGQDANRLAAYLNYVAQAKVDDDNTWAGTVTKATSSDADGGNYRDLARLYNLFTGINKGSSEARSGSAESVTRMMLDIYKTAKAINGQSANSGVQAMAEAICNAITTGTGGVSVTITTANDTPINFNDNNYNALDDATSPGVGAPDTWKATLSDAVNATFPANLGLPMGAAQIYFYDPSPASDATPGFRYNTSVHTGTPSATPADNKQITVDIDKLDYPAELIYFDNSPLRASSVYKTVNDYPTTPTTWDDAFNNPTSGDWTSDVVAATTRAVAMQNNVNYGVALFETTVALSGTTFTDNRAAVLAADGETTNQEINEAGNFKVTGILIGGQPATVGWDMTNPEVSTKFDHVIYDRDIPFTATALSQTQSQPNYTLVFDNYTGVSTGQRDVLFALQIVNGGPDFYGKDNIIPAGSTFYLVGKLPVPTSDNVPTTHVPNDYRAGLTNKYRITKEDVKRVFVQDYKTTANITIDATKALKNAYSTIPDLRSTETVFGLSVDLQWTPGYIYSVTIE